MKSIVNLFLFLVLVFNYSCTDSEVKSSGNSSAVSSNLDSLNKLISSSPNNPDLLHSRAKYHLSKQDFSSALVDMVSVLKLDSSKSDYYLTMSDIYFFTHKTSASKAALEKCISVDSNNVGCLMKLAELWFYVKKYDQAIVYLNKVLRRDVYNAKAYYMKGYVFKETGDTLAAISSLKTAVQQDRNHYDSYMQLGLLYSTKLDPIAVEYYLNALRIRPSSQETMYAIGKFHQDNKDWPRAIESYNSLLTVNPKHFSANYNLGVINGEYLKNYDESLKFFENAISSDPNDARGYAGRGWVYEQTEKKDLAIADYKKALEIDPELVIASEGIKRVK